ncbi:MAG: 3-dehydroquinate synthase [Pseudomonadales bacterium]|nr:3-dehydroquinate synthase [Pseudomonadales bacterium]
MRSKRPLTSPLPPRAQTLYCGHYFFDGNVPPLPTTSASLTVQLAARSYPIFIGRGLLADKSLFDRVVKQRDVLLVSNSTVAPLYAGEIARVLAPRRVLRADLADGESHKTLATVTRVLDVMVANRLGRDAIVVALGGGVVGDTAGFAAACYQRGVAFLQIPTTLLAQVDSSVGGKTGVNHPGGKNLIGAFHQPVAVIADTDTLTTLPDRELRAGLAEVIKYGLICDAVFFAWLEQNIDALLRRDAAALAHAIQRSCEVKADIVTRDEREQGDRALLNLGHTFGHAIEAATHYETWLHGEAVAVGMLMAARMSARMAWCPAEQVERLAELLRRAGLPTDMGNLRAAELRTLMKIDKKVAAGRVRLVLLRTIGAAVVTGDYPDAALDATLGATAA